MFIFLDGNDVLEHIVQLFLAQHRLRGHRRQLPLLRPLPRVLFAPEDLVELGHPGGDDRLFRKPVDLWQTADASFNVVLENIAEVGGRAGAVADHRNDAVAAQEDFEVALDGVDECFVGWNV